METGFDPLILTALITALIALLTSVIPSIIGYYSTRANQRDLEALKANFAAKQAENDGTGSVIPLSVPASLAVKPDKK